MEINTLLVNFPAGLCKRRRCTKIKTFQSFWFASARIQRRLPALCTSKKITTSDGKSETFEDWKKTFCFKEDTKVFCRRNDSLPRSVRAVCFSPERKWFFSTFGNCSRLLSFKSKKVGERAAVENARVSACSDRVTAIGLRWPWAVHTHRLISDCSHRRLDRGLINTFACLNYQQVWVNNAMMN